MDGNKKRHTRTENPTRLGSKRQKSSDKGKMLFNLLALEPHTDPEH